VGAVGRARAIARKILKKHGITSPPVDVAALIKAEAPGFRVIYEEGWPDHLSGLTSKAEQTIRINGTHSPLRRRFSLAHELGHICLEHEVILPHRIDEETIGPELEREADEFAGELLMPISMFKQAFHTHQSLDVLAEMFQVSTTAATVRALKLRLI
jgi:Zn-dependent peptidase ImmA (M78 family)